MLIDTSQWSLILKIKIIKAVNCATCNLVVLWDSDRKKWRYSNSTRRANSHALYIEVEDIFILIRTYKSLKQFDFNVNFFNQLYIRLALPKWRTYTYFKIYW